MRFTTITSAALDAWQKSWAGHSARSVAWPWTDVVADYQRHHPFRFELALWSGDVLCGLAVGRTGTAYCSIESLEGSPVAGHPLKGQVIPAALTALLAYSAVLGKGEMRLVEPVALVADFASRLIVRPDGLTAPEHAAFTRALVLSHQARPRPHGAPARPFLNTVVWIAAKESDPPGRRRPNG